MSAAQEACNAYDAGLRSVQAILFAIGDAGLFDDRGDSARARQQWEAGAWLMTLATQTLDATLTSVREIQKLD